ncbi:MAG: hypothetical protein M3Q71_18040 [Chloroflexota bacterium]|nr:hypothetical protein [Chloroflexota bacterium]MDP9472538.1 hypothetical protein [Chloroflexota bacterium]
MLTHAVHPCHDRLRFALRDGATLDQVARALAGRLASVDPHGLLAAYAFETEPGAVDAVVIFADGATATHRDETLDALAAKLADHAELVERRAGPAEDLLSLIQDGSRSLG